MYNTAFPLITVAGTANVLLSFIIACRLYMAHKSNPQSSHSFFMSFYIFFGMFFLFAFTAQLFFPGTQSGLIVGSLHVVSYFFLNISIGYLLAFPYQLLGKEIFARRIVYAAIIYSVVFTIFRIYYFEPSILVRLAEFVYWQPVFPEWLRIITGIISVSVAGFVSLFFLRYALLNKNDKLLRHKAMWLSAGICVLLIAATVGFIVAPRGVASHALVAALLVLWGLILTMRGILYTPQKSLEI